MTEPGAPTQPTAGQRPSSAQRAALSRDLSDFLIEFSIALHKHAMYPGGHPTLAPSSEGVARRMVSLLVDRGTLSLGVARDQLVIEGVATDPRNPVLRDLAERLHRHHLGAVSFARGVTGGEIDESLKLLAEDATRAAEPLGLRPVAKIPSWPHVRLYPLTFDRLQLLDLPEVPEGEEGGKVGTSPSGLQAAQLWVGLARAALASEGAARPAAPASATPATSAEPPPPPLSPTLSGRRWPRRRRRRPGRRHSPRTRSRRRSR